MTASNGLNATDHKRSISTTFHLAAAEFDQSGVPFFTPMGRRLVELVAPRTGDAVLDIGCGRGSCLFPATAVVGATGSVTGIDIAPAMVRATADEAADRGCANVSVHVMDGEHLEFADESFDVVTAGFSVMHLPHAPASLAHWLRVLRRGGLLGFSDLVDENGLPPFVPPAAFAVLEPHFPPGPNPKERGTGGWTGSVGDIRAALTGLGFADVRVHEETFEMVVSSGVQWNEWTLSTGLRAAWDNIDAQVRPGVWEASAQAIEAGRGPDGAIVLQVPVRYVIAHRPSGDNSDGS